ncbi:uncharacterized protein LOC135042967 [Pseudophryne corroboree]|uniref:uncharacterized protein LOC135042967 n=1 Tax=Pseudophryne corroboree TaxID=495146 RepID=UPI003081F777
MYQRSGNRGWHHGHHQSDIHAPRKPHSRPYRGGYHDHRGHGNYGPYHDSPCNDRNFNDNEYVEYPETPYRDFLEDRNYKEYRDHRDPAYHSGRHHNSSNNKFSGYHGGYQRDRGQSSHYQNKTSEPHYKKYDCKPAKSYKKENEVRVTTSTAKALQTVCHNSGPTVITLTTSSSEIESESKSPAQDKTKASHICEKPPQECTKAGKVCEKPSQESTKAGQVCEKPPQESTKAGQVCEKPSQESTKAGQVCENPSQESTKAGQVCEKPSQESTKAGQVCDKPSQESTKAGQVYMKSSHDSTKTAQLYVNPSQESVKATQVYKKPSQESAKATQVCEKPSQESINTSQIYEKPSQESLNATQLYKKPSQEISKSAQECAKVVQVCESSQKCANKSNVKKELMHQVCDRQKEKVEKAPPACDTKTVLKTKEDIVAAEERPQERQMLMRACTGKRLHSEERDYILNENQKDAETCVGKRICRSQDHYMDESYMEKTVQIPLLGEFVDMSPETIVPVGTIKQENSLPAVECGLSDNAQNLRTAFILARKEEIELAFAQDCKSFACVASTLLKKDPTIEAAVTNALRSSLQEVAGRCVQELTNFIDHYDKVLVNTSNRLQE